jgi:hypothetical protein
VYFRASFSRQGRDGSLESGLSNFPDMDENFFFRRFSDFSARNPDVFMGEFYVSICPAKNQIRMVSSFLKDLLDVLRGPRFIGFPAIFFDSSALCSATMENYHRIYRSLPGTYFVAKKKKTGSCQTLRFVLNQIGIN